MKVEELLTVGECCCFDLRTGGLIIGFIDLILSAFSIWSGLRDPISFYFLFICAIAAIEVGFVYGIYKNQPKYMWISVLWSLEKALLCVGLLICLGIGFLSFSDQFMRLKSRMSHPKLAGMMTATEAAEVKQAAEVIEVYFIAICTVIWIVFSFVTWILWYFAKVKYSLYQAMNRSLKNFPSQAPLTSFGMDTTNLK